MGYDFTVIFSQCGVVAFVFGLLTLVCGPRTALLWAFVWACASADIVCKHFPRRHQPAKAITKRQQWRLQWRWWMLPVLAALVALLVYGVDCLLLFLDDVL